MTDVAQPVSINRHHPRPPHRYLLTIGSKRIPANSPLTPVRGWPQRKAIVRRKPKSIRDGTDWRGTGCLASIGAMAHANRIASPPLVVTSLRIGFDCRFVEIVDLGPERRPVGNYQIFGVHLFLKDSGVE